MKIYDCRLAVVLLEVVDFDCDGEVENVDNIILLIVIKLLLVKHVITSGLWGWVDEVSLRVVFIIPIEGLHLFHIFKVSGEGDGHTLRNNSLHVALTPLNLIRLVFRNNLIARVLNHDPIKRILIRQVVDLDVLRMLPMHVDIMIIHALHLGLNLLLSWQIVHRHRVVDYHPP